MPIDRSFVQIEEGQIHYRGKTADTPQGALPLYMAHAGPVSSASLIPLIDAVSPDRDIYAPDTLGFGDSAPPGPDAPDLAYFVDSVVRVMDALGLDKVDYYGSHTGAHIGCELAIAHPDRVNKLVFEGLALFDAEERQELRAHYAPQKQPDEYGSQFQWAWQFMRDQTLFFPYFKRDAEHRLGNAVMPPDMLHAFVVDVLKALTTYHKGYNAVFAQDTAARLPEVTHPVLLLAHAFDPLNVYLDDAAALTPNGQHLRLDETVDSAAQAKLMEAFFDA